MVALRAKEGNLVQSAKRSRICYHMNTPKTNRDILRTQRLDRGWCGRMLTTPIHSFDLLLGRVLCSENVGTHKSKVNHILATVFSRPTLPLQYRSFEPGSIMQHQHAAHRHRQTPNVYTVAEILAVASLRAINSGPATCDYDRT